LARHLLAEFNSDTIESLNRIIVPYLNRQSDPQVDALSNQHLKQLLRVVKEMYNFTFSDEILMNQENLLRFFQAMLTTLARNLKPNANLAYLRLLYGAADFIL
jgi:hypothetical protein